MDYSNSPMPAQVNESRGFLPSNQYRGEQTLSAKCFTKMISNPYTHGGVSFSMLQEAGNEKIRLGKTLVSTDVGGVCQRQGEDSDTSL